MIHFTGTTRAAYGNITALNGTAALTLAWWWVPGTFVSAGGVFGKGSLSPFRVINFSGTGQLTFQDTTGQVRNTSADFTVGALCHVAIVFDGSLAAANRAELYRNGVLLARTNVSNFGATLAAGDTSALLVGFEVSNSVALTQDFGLLRIWQAALTAAEIVQEMQKYRAARRANLLLDCPYDDGILCTDYSPLRNAVTVTGTPTSLPGPPVSYGAPVLV